MRFAEVVKDKGDLGGMERRDAAIDRVLIGEDVGIYGSRPGLGFRSECVSGLNARGTKSFDLGLRVRLP